jgi:hypothetical protein
MTSRISNNRILQPAKSWGLIPLILVTLSLLAACSSSSDTTSLPTGKLVLTVVSEAGLPIEGAQIQLFQGTTGEVQQVLTTPDDGKVVMNLAPSNYQLKIAAQNFFPSPPTNIEPAPVAVLVDQTQTLTVTLITDPEAATSGTISGVVRTIDGSGLSGVLVTAGNDNGWQATSSDQTGRFKLFNVPSGQISLQGWKSGYNVEAETLSVNANQISTNTLTATADASGQITGKVSFTSVEGAIVDVTLLHPDTHEVIPGLRTELQAGSFDYQIENVPNGTYQIIASLDNDGYVLDPDESVQQGIPMVTVEGNDLVADFKVTGAIKLDSPTPGQDNLVPEVTTTPTFNWSKRSSYANADTFAVEVVDQTGSVIWGGFGPNGEILVPVVDSGGESWSLAFDADGSANSALLASRYYQVRIYAAKDDKIDPRGYKLVSATETLDGLFKVVQP